MAVLICDMCFWWNGILGQSLSWELQSHRANCNESENDHCNTYTWQRQHFHEHNTFLSHKEAWPKLSVIIKKACLLQKPTNWWQRSITYSTRAGTILCFTTSIYWSIFIAIYQYIEGDNGCNRAMVLASVSCLLLVAVEVPFSTIYWALWCVWRWAKRFVVLREYGNSKLHKRQTTLWLFTAPSTSHGNPK